MKLLYLYLFVMWFFFTGAITFIVLHIQAKKKRKNYQEYQKHLKIYNHLRNTYNRKWH